MTARIIFSFFAGVLLVCGLAWFGGFDFNERSTLALVVAIFAVIGGAFGVFIVIMTSANFDLDF